jgi:hypothetical protein
VVPGVGGSSPLTHPKIDRLLSCSGVSRQDPLQRLLTQELAEILIPHVADRASDGFVFISPGGKAWWRHNFYNRC